MLVSALLGVAGCVAVSAEHAGPAVELIRTRPAKLAPSVMATAGPSLGAVPADSASSLSATPSAVPAVSAAVQVDPCAGPGDATKTTDLTCADRKAWFAKLAWPQECEHAYDATGIYGIPSIEFHAIAKGRYIVAVQCTLGAYQGYSIYLLYQEPRDASAAPKAKLLSFRTYVAPRDNVLERTSTSELWGQAEFDDAKQELTVWNRYRGPGDCGLLTTYGFTNGQPYVKTMRGKNVCDGQFVDPAAWPRVPAP